MESITPLQQLHNKLDFFQLYIFKKIEGSLPFDYDIVRSHLFEYRANMESVLNIPIQITPYGVNS